MINEHPQNVFTMSITFQVSKCPILIWLGFCFC